MKLHLALSLLVVNAWAFAQIQERPADFKKIKFVYETKSNYKIENQRIYADTALFREDFPNLKWLAQPKPDGGFDYFAPIASLNTTELTKLRGILYHENQTYTGEYDKEKDKTVFQVVRDDKALKKIFNEVFHDTYHYFSYKIVINYKKGTYNTYYPSVSYENSIGENTYTVVFQNDTVGVFKKTILKKPAKSIVVLNKKLDPKIMPEELFSNAAYGVEVVRNLGSTTVLKSVMYSN